MSTKKPNKQAIGTIQKLLASALYGSMGLWAVLMAGTFAVFNQAYIRATIILVILTVVGFTTKQFRKIKKKDWKWFLLIMLGGLNAAPSYYGFIHLGSSIGTLIFIVALVVGGYLLARFFFQEKITAIKLASLVIATAGLLAIYRFGLSADQIWPAIVMTVAGLMAAMSNVLPKKLTNVGYSQVHIMTMMFLSVLAVFLICSIITREGLPVFGWNMAWIALIVYALAHISAMYLSVTSFKVLDASVGSLLEFSEIIFGVLLGIIFLGEEFLPIKVVGFILITLGLSLEHLVAIYTSRRRHRVIQ